MNKFIHGRMGHYLQDETGEGGAPSGGAPAAEAATTDAAPTPTAEGSSLFGGGDAPAADVGAETNAEQVKDAAKEEGKEDETKKDEKPEGAPEAYETFTVPEGIELADEVMPDVQALFKELGLPQERAQETFEKLLAIQEKINGTPEEQIQRAEQQIVALNTSLAEQCKALPEIGGEKFAESLTTASKAMQQFGDPELRSLIALTGVGSHPAFFKMMVKIGSMMSPDTFEQGGEEPQAQRRAADAMFGHLFPKS